MKIVLIRHGEKLYDNGMSKSMKLDPPLKETERERCLNILDRYIETYPDITPGKILVSPFLRCRQTAQIIKSRFNEVEIEIVPQLSEFLGFQKNINPNDFHFETYKNSPYGIEHNKRETLNMFENRVMTFMNGVINEVASEVTSVTRNEMGNEVTSATTNEPLWIVTHGLFINLFLKNYDIPSSRMKAFKGVIIDDDSITFI